MVAMKKFCQIVRSLSLGCMVLMFATPVLAESCITPDKLKGSGALLETQSGVIFLYQWDGESLNLTIYENGIRNAAPTLRLNHHGLLGAGWDRTAIGEGRIAHIYEPDITDLPMPGPGVLIRTMRTNLKVAEIDGHEDDPVSIEDVEFRFGEETEFEIGDCIYRGLRLNTQTYHRSGGEPVKLSGIWLFDFEIFVIERIVRKGSFDQQRVITSFRAQN